MYSSNAKDLQSTRSYSLLNRQLQNMLEKVAGNKEKSMVVPLYAVDAQHLAKSKVVGVTCSF